MPISFEHLKDHVAIASVTLIIGWNGAQLYKLNETATKVGEELVTIGKELVSLKKDSIQNTYRLDQHRESLTKMRDTQSSVMSRLSVLEVKVFGKSIQF